MRSRRRFLTLHAVRERSYRGGVLTRSCRRRTAVALGALLLACTIAVGKEEHLEKVKFELLSHYLKCSDCHVDEKGKDLTLYGKRLNAMGTTSSLRERVRRQERRVSPTLARMEPGAEDDRVDIDGDGALNWVEILCGTDPSDPKSVLPLNAEGDAAATPSLRKRLETLVDCRLCHVSVDTTGPEEKAPHNPLGESIAKLDTPPANTRPGSRTPAPTREPSDFLTRFKRIANQDLDRDKVRNWDEIATFHNPTDPADAPTPDELKVLQALLQSIRRGETGFGKAHKE